MRTSCLRPGRWMAHAKPASGLHRSACLLCRALEPPHLLQVFGVGVAEVRPRLRVDAGRTNHADRLGDILWTEPAGQNDGRLRPLDDLPADAPVMGDAKRPDLSVLRSIAVQQQVVCD